MPPSPGSPPAPPVSPPSPPTCDALCGVDLGGKVQYGSCVPGGSAGAACGSVGGEWAGTLAVGCSNDGCYCCVSKDGGVTPEPPTVPEPPAPPGPPPPPPLPSTCNSSFELSATNGVTVTCDCVQVGDKGIVVINGQEIEFTKVDRPALNEIVGVEGRWGELPTVCTSGIDDMSELFKSKGALNEDISRWDTSSVTDMSGMWVLTSPAMRSPAPTRSRSLRVSLARSPGSAAPRPSTRPSIAGTRAR